MTKLSRLGCMLVVCLFMGCSDDSDETDAGSTAGSGGSGGNVDGGSGTNGGTGGDGGSLEDGGLSLTCDPDVTSVTSCGDETCPTLPPNALEFCQVTCCTANDECGQRNTSDDPAIQQIAGTCAVPPEPDPSCPSPMFMGMTIPSCCTSQGVCGISFGTSCFANPMDQNPPSCGGDDAGTP